MIYNYNNNEIIKNNNITRAIFTEMFCVYAAVNSKPMRESELPSEIQVFTRIVFEKVFTRFT